MEKIKTNSAIILAKETLDLISMTPALRRETFRTEKLIERLSSKQVEVAIIGQFKRGKSSVANKILGEELMPVGIVPITSAVTKVVSGNSKPKVYFNDGRVEEVSLDQLSQYISEQENKNNTLDVKEVVLTSNSSFLEGNTVFVDTPGVGSFHVNNTETAYEHMKESDAVIFLLSVDSPINQIEIEFLQKASAYAGKFYFAVNKADMVSEEDLTTYMDYCRNLIGQITNRDPSSLAFFAVSAKNGSGIDQLKAAIKKDQETGLREIMELSSLKKLTDIIDCSMASLSLYRKAMNMPYPALDEKFALMDQFLKEERTKLSQATGLFPLHINQLKLSISQKVKELFDMDYTYYIDSLEKDMAGLDTMTKEQFEALSMEICDQLESTLNEILLYREENAYLVVKKISQINTIVRGLRHIKKNCLEAENMV